MEDGFNSGWRHIGWFFVAAIPYILGAAALVWLGFAMGARGFFNQLSQEKRRAIYVGAEHPPKSKLRVETPNEGTVKVERVDLDGSTATLYLKNTGQGTAKSIYIHWQLVSPNGVALKSGARFSQYLDGPDVIKPGETGEVVFSGYDGIALDKRAEAIRFWVEYY